MQQKGDETLLAWIGDLDEPTPVLARFDAVLGGLVDARTGGPLDDDADVWDWGPLPENVRHFRA